MCRFMQDYFHEAENEKKNQWRNVRECAIFFQVYKKMYLCMYICIFKLQTLTADSTCVGVVRI